MSEIETEVVRFLTQYGFQILGALIILTVGAMIARWIGRTADRWFTQKQVEPPLRMLAVRVIRLLVFGLALMLALDKCGVPITPMIAGLGVAGVGIGLATQHVLSNVVAGLTIIFTKPYRVGEYVEIAQVHGQVDTVGLFSTILQHVDQSRVVVPNRKIVGEILHNFGAIRQLDLHVGVAYDVNIKETLALVREILTRNPRVLKEPAPIVGIIRLGDSSVDIGVKPWVSVRDYANAASEVYETLLEEFRARNIQIPYPQREVRLLNAPAGDIAQVPRSG
jgi:small conductance mechanosensitive channel